jgi:hypothetical protein
MCPALDQLPEFLLFYSIYVIPFTFKYNYSLGSEGGYVTRSTPGRSVAKG